MQDPVIGPLPQDLSRLSTGLRDREVEVRDKRVSLLMKRWPHGLTKAESRELKRLWDERVRLAKFSRRGGGRTDSARDGRDDVIAEGGPMQGDSVEQDGALVRRLVARVQSYQPGGPRAPHPALVSGPGGRARPGS